MKKLSNGKLWRPQLQAMKIIEAYLDSKNPSSALVRMPTGTGKSGIMAVLCQYKIKGSVLIVVPWVALRTQLSHEIGVDFWKKLRHNARIPKNTVQFTSSGVRDALKRARNQDTIFVCNIQSLVDIHTNQHDDYEALRREIRLVLFDEGHREPAPQWARAIRELNRPTILFTATPYRNDHKMFNISKDFVYVYSYGKALSERYVRDIKFHLMTWHSAEEFVRLILHFFHGEFKKIKPSVESPRVIIRCETRGEVNEIATILKSKGQNVVAIHESFAGSHDFRYRSVPSPATTDAVFWVHQYKLVEGIDDPSFCLLAIYRPFKNARSLVQQIGRITRNPRQVKNQVAHVIAAKGDSQLEFWEKYCDYEQYFEEHPELHKVESMYDLSRSIQPFYGYFEGKFRHQFQIDSPEFYKHLRYRLAAYCFKIAENFLLAELLRELEDEWTKADFQIKNIVQPTDDTIVFVYITYENSLILLDESYIEFRLGFTICKRIGPYLFFYDSNGKSCEYLTNNADRIDPKTLQHLFNGTNARLTELSLLNTDLGKYSIRRRVIDARSLSDTAPALGDFAHVPSTTKGFTNFQKLVIQRYVGFSRARVSDSSTEDIGYDEYVIWLSALAQILDARPRTLALFNRYAGFIRAPPDPAPVGILIDISDISDFFQQAQHLTNGKPHSLVIDELYARVTDGQFELQANSEAYAVRIEYDDKTHRYNLCSPELEQAFVRKASAPEDVADTIIKHLNREQSFRIVVKTPGIIYAHSHFYKPRLPIAGEVSEGFDLLRILYPVKDLATIESEKGIPLLNGKGWTRDSIFGIIDNLGKGTGMNKDFKDIDLLICDDLGNEIADFIATNTSDNKVIFIHAKAATISHLVSASSFHVVCAQVMKNLHYLHPMITENPPNIKKWNRPWTDGRATVKKRIRKGQYTSNGAWKKISSMIRDPVSTKEVWIILGKGFSLQHFENERNKPDPAPEVIQILYLLLSTWRSVSEVGAILRIFCSP